MAGNFLGTRPDFPIDVFIQQLKKGDRLSLLNRIAGRGDPNVEAVLRISLEATSAERASRWRSLAVFPSTIDPYAAQAIWKMSSAEEARHELSEMTTCSLLLHDGKRHFMHELMSDIARSDLKMSPVKWAAAHESFSRFYCEMLRRWNGNLLDGQVKLSIILSHDWRNIRAGHDWATKHRLESEAARKLCIDYALSGAYILGLRQPFDVRFDWINDALGAVDSGAQQDVFARARLLDERGVAFREHGNPRRALDDHRLAMNISKSPNLNRISCFTLSSIAV